MLFRCSCHLALCSGQRLIKGMRVVSATLSGEETELYVHGVPERVPCAMTLMMATQPLTLSHSRTPFRANAGLLVVPLG